MDAAQIRELLDTILARVGDRVTADAAPRPTPVPDPPPEVATLRVRVDLHGASPPIWRRLELAGDLRLDAVHRVLQVAMGWTDSHLHAFAVGASPHDRSATRFLTAFDLEEGEEGVPETEVRLDQVLRTAGDTLFYEYDFGDGWEHRLVLEDVRGRGEGAVRARCLQGRRSCPPEDVGGVHAWNDLVRVLAGDAPPDGFEDLLTWLPDDIDPAAFDLDAVNARLRFAVVDADGAPDGLDLPPVLVDLLGSLDAGARPMVEELVARAGLDAPVEVDPADAAATVRRLAWLLDRVGGDGVKLTAAGYLPPAVVSEAFEALDLGDEWIGKGNREDHTLPVLVLRETAQQLGLLRKYRGTLLLTRAGARCRRDPRALWEHVARSLPLGRDEPTRVAGLLMMLDLLDTSPDRVLDGAAAGVLVLGSLGYRTRQGRLGRDDVLALARPTLDLLDQLGVVPRWRPVEPIKRLTPAGRALLRTALTTT